MANRQSSELVFRSLVPINRFARDAQQRLWQTVELRSLKPGQTIFVGGDDDGFVHYLMVGDLEFFEQERLVRPVGLAPGVARRPLDGRGARRFTARARTPCTIAILSCQELDRAGESTRLLQINDALTVSELICVSGQDWMSRTMDSALFQILSPRSIRQLFSTIDVRAVAAGEKFLKQGELGDAFYLLETGYCEVTRRAGTGRLDVHVRDLRPGDSFGETALISKMPRETSVVALTDAQILCIAGADFDRLVRRPLVHSLGVGGALAAVSRGACWLDISDPEIYTKAPLRHSQNIPLGALRRKIKALDGDKTYIVCGEDPSRSAVGAYMLAERGLKSFYLEEPVIMALARENGVSAVGR